MELIAYFNDFLRNIRLTEQQLSELKKGHETLRELLSQDEDLSKIIVSTFLQGSYRRATAIKPRNGQHSDVDVVVVTNINKEKITPDAALKMFIPFLEKHYRSTYRVQGRSIGISLSYVDLDLVVTAAPSESDVDFFRSDTISTDLSLEETQDWRLVKSWVDPRHRDSFSAQRSLEESKRQEEWQLSPLYIPDREAKEWKPTHPLEQIKQTQHKNAATNTHYINVVKAIKWWKRYNHPDAGQPKSYPLEHLLWHACPDHIQNVAEGITLSLEAIVNRFPPKPYLPDHGVPQHDVMGRVTAEEYEIFYSQVKRAASIARSAYDSKEFNTSHKEWTALFGDQFPPAPENKTGGFTPRENTISQPSGGRFA